MSRIRTIPNLTFATFFALFSLGNEHYAQCRKLTNTFKLLAHQQIIKSCLEILKTYYILRLNDTELMRLCTWDVRTV